MTSMPARILVVGSGGREHALAWHLRGGATPIKGRELLVCPGNAGIAREIRCEAPRGAGVQGIVQLARDERVDLVVVGPEQWLADGLVDALAQAGIAAFGPTQAAAKLESSKAFMKAVCTRAGVATAGFVATKHVDDARDFIDSRARAGKGVVVCADPSAAMAAVEDMLAGPCKAPRFGEASRTIVIEDLLPGEELSVFAICDGYEPVLFGAARDHKRLGDNDQGPNTGGMGAVAPLSDAQGVPAAMLSRLRESVFLPVLDEMRARGAPFRGLLFAGLMIDDGAVRVLEFNVRFGDPETEALMLATSTDLAPMLMAVAQGERLAAGQVPCEQRAAAVVLAAEGYPHAPQSGALIEGLEDAERVEGAKIFCAGMVRDDEGRLRVSGGRVLAVCGQGPSFAIALDRAYAAADKIRISGAHMRRDIGRSVR